MSFCSDIDIELEAIETASTDELQALQLKRMKWTLDLANYYVLTLVAKG